MSSLLDVLHKRPPRAQLAAAGAAPLAPAGAPPQAAELHLAPEPEAGIAAGTATLRRPALPGDDGATVEMPSPGATVEMPAPGAAADAAPAGARRWTDAAGTTIAMPAVAAPPSPAPAPAAAARRPAGSGRLPLVLLACVLVAGAVAWLGLQLATPADEGFLAAPPAGPAPPADGSAPATAEAQPAPPDAPSLAPPPRRQKRPGPVVADAVAAGPADAAEPAWYDQPALPAEALALPETPLVLVATASSADPVFDTVRAAYDALLAGDAARAESLYREALAADAGNVDALLGLGALAARGGRAEEARDLYRRVQALDPRNATAAAALSALPGGAAPGTATESGLRTLLREQPGAAALHFALGQRYVADGRWPDAQSAFFEAVRHEPTNADYAFNLAVSLDRLGQAGPAASYYRRALELASGSQQFDRAAAGARLATLQGAGG